MKALLLPAAERCGVLHGTGITAAADFDPDLAEVGPRRGGAWLAPGWIYQRLHRADHRSWSQAIVAFSNPPENKLLPFAAADRG